MKETGIIRKLDDLGRFLIPRQIRAKLYGSTAEGKDMELFYEEDGTIILKPVEPCKKDGGLSVETAAGTFFADVETTKDTPHNSIYLSFQPAGSSDIIDIAAIKDTPAKGGPQDVQLLVFGDISNEDPTQDILILRQEIEEALSIEGSKAPETEAVECRPHCSGENTYPD